ncbi:hypothetical protein CFB81_22635 [Burkholderia sp. AU28863]|nr:hypothetical protein CFB81_22635 [Burkholderia sp. AU28863]
MQMRFEYRIHTPPNGRRIRRHRECAAAHHARPTRKAMLDSIGHALSGIGAPWRIGSRDRIDRTRRSG